ncbi:hypothetical protein V8E52_007783 [Russula decolorans]
MTDPNVMTKDLDSTFWQTTYEKLRCAQLRRGKLAKKEIANGAETEDLDSTSWQRTYEKLQRAQLRRDKFTKKEIANGAETLHDIFKSDKIPSDTVPTYHSESPWVGTILLACYTSIPPVVLSPAPPASEGSSLKVPRVSNPASPAAKPRGNKHCPPSEYTPTEVSDVTVQSSLCDSMQSLSVASSPPASPRRQRKYYVVSVGKCVDLNRPEALSVYQNIKAKGLVWIIRDPGDETFFGCIEDAIHSEILARGQPIFGSCPKSNVYNTTTFNDNIVIRSRAIVIWAQ